MSYDLMIERLVSELSEDDKNRLTEINEKVNEIFKPILDDEEDEVLLIAALQMCLQLNEKFS